MEKYLSCAVTETGGCGKVQNDSAVHLGKLQPRTARVLPGAAAVVQTATPAMWCVCG